MLDYYSSNEFPEPASLCMIRYTKHGRRGVATDKLHMTYFLYKEVKYIWHSGDGKFVPLRNWCERPSTDLLDAKPLSDFQADRRRMLYGKNQIEIEVPSIPSLVLSQCLHPFYCFQVASCILWYIDEYMMYASCIVILSILSLSWEVYELYTSKVRLRKTVCSSDSVSVYRNATGNVDLYQLDSKELVPGDIIAIPCNGCVMHCDAILLNGSCIVNESTLTGESVPITKTALPDQRDQSRPFSIHSSGRHVLFCGTKVIQTRNFANEPVMALVARTGFQTTKGELVRSILFPQPFKFKFIQDAYRFVAALGLIALVGFCVSLYIMAKAKLETYLIVTRALDLITVVVPPALPVAMSVGTAIGQRRLRQLAIYCTNSAAIIVCGVINAVCFDKTGTLTEDDLDLLCVVPNHGTNNFGSYEDVQPGLSFQSGPLIECMASCHSLTLIEGLLSGDPLDLKMFAATGWDFIEEVTEDHCKFDMAVPAIVRPASKNPSVSVTTEVGVDVLNKLPYEVGIIRQFPFTSSHQRMSVIARVLGAPHFNLYAKGAPEMIESLCRRDTIPMNFHHVLLKYTLEGYRVLALAWRPVKVSYTRVQRLARESIEKDLQFLGLLVMENRLKPESCEVIKTLHDANIRTIMVTGDNMLTAISVARDCEMMQEHERLIIVSAKPPTDSNNQLNEGENESSASSSSNDQERPTPLVEFHYAEDLHKPVVEVVASVSRRHEGQGDRGPTTASSSNFKRNLWLRRSQSTWLPSCICPNQTGGESTSFLHPSCNGSTANSSLSLSPNVVDDNRTDTMSTINASPEGPPPPPTIHHRPSCPLHIRLLDRPDFHLAVSGKTWGVIYKHYPWLISKLVVKTAICARFSPDQKTQLVESLQSVGYYVAMCGDGANDCGALKAAHAGVSLSEAEASVASPFTTKKQGVQAVPLLIKQGRCALTTNFGTFKFIMGYSFVQFFSVLILYTIGSSISDSEFFFIDFFLITSLGLTFGYAGTYPTLSATPPDMHLVSISTFASLGSQLVTCLLIQLAAYYYVQQQAWYYPSYEYNKKHEFQNFESTTIFTVSVYQYFFLALFYSKGAPYRQSILHNYAFLINLLLCIIVSLIITCNSIIPLANFMEMMIFPSYKFSLILHGIVLAYFFFGYSMEMLIDTVAFKRQMRKLRHALFPRRVHHADYEVIREEIDRMAGQWPPIIRSASVHALPKELFHAGDVGDQQSVANASNRLSSNIDDEEEECEFKMANNAAVTFTSATRFARSRSQSSERAGLNTRIGYGIWMASTDVLDPNHLLPPPPVRPTMDCVDDIIPLTWVDGHSIVSKPSPPTIIPTAKSLTLLPQLATDSVPKAVVNRGGDIGVTPLLDN